jgi:hypothetical protein
VRYVHEKEPRLEGVFEGEWATDWVLKKPIDQRVADAKRVGGSAHKRKRGTDGKRKGKKMSKLVVV